jgi:hypothetical protein
LPIFYIVLIGFTGCRGAAPTPSLSKPASDESTLVESFSVARPTDLRLSIYGVKPAPNDFPSVLLTVQNISSRDTIVAYERGSLTIHCGPYVQQGPETFRRRREILGPWSTIVFDPPADGWTQTTSGGPPELMLPVKLPPGKYDVWASFQVDEPNGGSIRSDHRVYTVK